MVVRLRLHFGGGWRRIRNVIRFDFVCFGHTSAKTTAFATKSHCDRHGHDLSPTFRRKATEKALRRCAGKRLLFSKALALPASHSIEFADAGAAAPAPPPGRVRAKTFRRP